MLACVQAILLISGNGPKEGEGAANSPWTPENKYLTASNKLNRGPIKETFNLHRGEFPPVKKLAVR